MCTLWTLGGADLSSCDTYCIVHRLHNIYFNSAGGSVGSLSSSAGSFRRLLSVRSAPLPCRAPVFPLRSRTFRLAEIRPVTLRTMRHPLSLMIIASHPLTHPSSRHARSGWLSRAPC